MISIDELLEELDSLMDGAVNVPLGGGRAVVNTEKIRRIIDDIRLHLPDEIRQARAIAAERNEIIAEARKEAESISRRAEERARAMTSNEEIVRRATIQANETISQANTKAKEIRKRAIDYAEDIMKVSEDTLSKQLADLRQSRQNLRTTSRNEAAENPAAKPAPKGRAQQAAFDEDEE